MCIVTAVLRALGSSSQPTYHPSVGCRLLQVLQCGSQLGFAVMGSVSEPWIFVMLMAFSEWSVATMRSIPILFSLQLGKNRDTSSTITASDGIPGILLLDRLAGERCGPPASPNICRCHAKRKPIVPMIGSAASVD